MSGRSAVLAVLATCCCPVWGLARASDLLPDADQMVSPVQPATQLKLSHDAADRMTVPVMINGAGPYHFVVDTGADRSVISAELAAKLALPPGPAVTVRSTLDVQTEPSVAVASFQVGQRVLTDLRAPVLSRAALGADGMIGVDALRDQSIVLDFAARRMSLRPSRAASIDPGAVLVEGRNRYGQLILLDAMVQDEPVFVILDTGAETSIVNSTFRRELEDGRPAGDGHAPARIISVTGGTGDGQFGQLSELTLGRMTMRDLPIVFSDLAIFSHLHLTHRPAMLLGMDVLRVFDRVEIDYPNRHVTFRLNGNS